MSDPLKTLEEVTQLLTNVRVDCAWDSTAYKASAFVYVSRKDVDVLNTLLTRLKSECELLQDQLGKWKVEGSKVDSAQEEIDHLDHDNNSLRQSLKNTIDTVLSKDLWIAKQKDALYKLRGVFGTSIPLLDLQRLLAHVDEILKS